MVDNRQHAKRKRDGSDGISMTKSRHRMTTRSSAVLQPTDALSDMRRPLAYVIDESGRLGNGHNGVVFQARAIGDPDGPFRFAVKVYPWEGETKNTLPDEAVITALAGIYSIGPRVHQVSVVKDLSTVVVNSEAFLNSRLGRYYTFSLITHSPFLCIVMDKIPGAKPVLPPHRRPQRMTRTVARYWHSVDTQIKQKLSVLKIAKIKHADLVYANVLVGSDNVVYFVDWGEASIA